MIKKNWLILIVVFLVLILLGLVIKSKFFSQPGFGALEISTTPKAVVFLDGKQVGVTPFSDNKIPAGEHTIKLVPEPSDANLLSWEGRVNLTAGILTVIKRTLASSEASSSGHILSLEKIGTKRTSSLLVISVPDQAVVKIDGEPRGFTPLSLEKLPPGDYQVSVSSPGYEEKTITAHTIAGYKLVVNIQLARLIEVTEEASPSGEKQEEEETTLPPSEEVTPSPTTTLTPSPPAKPYIKVKTTPTGWLRVREKPSTASRELTKIYPGETYPYLKEEKNGWYKIEYEENKEGWVSGVYIELVETD